MSMAFENEDLFTLVDQVVNSLYEGLENDYYQVSKYVLARRCLLWKVEMEVDTKKTVNKAGELF